MWCYETIPKQKKSSPLPRIDAPTCGMLWTEEIRKYLSYTAPSSLKNQKYIESVQNKT